MMNLVESWHHPDNASGPSARDAIVGYMYTKKHGIWFYDREKEVISVIKMLTVFLFMCYCLASYALSNRNTEPETSTADAGFLRLKQPLRRSLSGCPQSIDYSRPPAWIFRINEDLDTFYNLRRGFLQILFDIVVLDQVDPSDAIC